MARLKSGETYTLAEIFSGDNDKIVISDLQRDYCWGDEGVNLVGQFVKSLKEMDKTEPITMGLLYGYFNHYTPEHLQLCDGQQRLTTLFLLLGMLNRGVGGNLFKKYLISDFELELDDNEPYLQYAIRESSLYFLSDLTIHFFLCNDLKSTSDIKKQPWYLSNYSLDPTVCSILNAIDCISEELKDNTADEMNDLAAFVLNKLEFLFFDLENRENGEETFVVINTTGEPLSATQNLKPLVIDYNKDCLNVAERWEDMETWFWRNRRRDADHPHTSDEGMECFLNVVRLIHAETEQEAYNEIENQDRFPYTEILFEKLYNTFLAYKRLYGLDFSARKDPKVEYPSKLKYYTQERLFAVCTTVSYCVKFPQSSDDEVKRIYHLFCNMARYVDVSRRKDKDELKSPLFRAVSSVKRMQNLDVICLKNAEILSAEEKLKLSVIQNVLKDKGEQARINTEVLFADAERSEILKGRIRVLLDWASNDTDSFCFYWEKFKSTWHGETDYDIVRRTLLAFGMEEYPITRKGYGNLLSLCGNNDDWYSFIMRNKNSLRSFFESTKSFGEIIESFADTNHCMYRLIKDSKLMGRSEYKNCYIYDGVVVVMKKERTNSDYWLTYKGLKYDRTILYQGNSKIDWCGIWSNGNCIYSDASCNLTIDYFMKPDGYSIVVWQGKHPDRQAYQYYDQLYLLGFAKNEYDRLELPIIADGREARAKLIEIAKRIATDLPLTDSEQHL